MFIRGVPIAHMVNLATTAVNHNIVRVLHGSERVHRGQHTHFHLLLIPITIFCLKNAPKQILLIIEGPIGGVCLAFVGALV